MEASLTVTATVLLAATAYAFAQQWRILLVLFGTLFVPAAGAATVAVYWPLHPLLAVVLLSVTLGISLAGLLLYAVDRIWAPFCIEMTYAALVCWLLWPLLMAADLAGLAARALLTGQ
jgi:hypothetical protein